MQARNLIGTGFLLFLVCAQAQQEQRFVLLPPRESNTLAEEFPRKGPERIDGSWQPTIAQIQTLETNLSRISDLTSDDNPNAQKIDHPDRYFRQYVAVVRAGERLIYINALCNVHSKPEWRTRLIRVLDGGNCYWQAWYDPVTGTFSELTVNGRA